MYQRAIFCDITQLILHDGRHGVVCLGLELLVSQSRACLSTVYIYTLWQWVYARIGILARGQTVRFERVARKTPISTKNGSGEKPTLHGRYLRFVLASSLARAPKDKELACKHRLII